MSYRLCSLLITGTVAGLLLPHTASAGGFYVARFGGELGGVTGRHVVSIYYNPAGLTADNGTRVYAEGIVAHRAATYERPEGAVDNILGQDEGGNGTPEYRAWSNTGTASLNNWLASPFIGVASDVGVPNLTVGLATYAPFGGTAAWDSATNVRDTTFPGAKDGVQRWWTIDGSLRSMYVSGAAAYKIPRYNLSVGATLSWVQSTTHTIRARTATGTDDLISSTGSSIEGRSLLDVQSNNYALGLGAQWTPNDRVRVGLSYQSQPGFGEMGLKGTLTTQLGSAEASDTNVEMRQSLPDIWRAGAEYQVTPRLTANAQVTFARWSVFQDQCILDANMPERKCALTENGGADMENGAAGIIANLPRHWSNTWTIGAGGQYQLRDRLLAMGGASYDMSAVPDETLDPALMDMEKFTGTLGVVFSAGKRVNVSAQLSHVLYLDRSVAPRERDENGDVMDAPASPSRNPDAAGNYSQRVTFVTLGAETRF